MRLRQKKTHNLSEQAFYSDFQNLHFQTLNRKLENNKIQIKDPYNASYSINPDKQTYAQILVKFISNTNLAKHPHQIKTKSKSLSRNVLREQNHKPKKFRKISQNASFEQEKKVEHHKTPFKESETLTRKIRMEEKSSKGPNPFSINKTDTNRFVSSNKAKELPEQNIINNCLVDNSFNMNEYAKFIQSPYFALNTQIMNNWYQINPFLKPNWENLTSLAEEMKNGLYRQLQIYERFKPQPSPSEIQRKSLPFTAPPQHKDQKQQKQISMLQSSNKMNPDKIFKRASYHVGIAYSIYMDNIQREGNKIKNFSDIDPTRFAKKYKSTIQKS